jgi:hypothetical protein
MKFLIAERKDLTVSKILIYIINIPGGAEAESPELIGITPRT